MLQDRLLFPCEIQKIEILVVTQERHEADDDTSGKRRLRCLDDTRREDGIVLQQQFDIAPKRWCLPCQGRPFLVKIATIDYLLVPIDNRRHIVRLALPAGAWDEHVPLMVFILIGVKRHRLAANGLVDVY